MKYLFILFLCTTISQLGAAQTIKSKPNNEPQQNIELTINGKKYIVKEGEELTINETLIKPKLTAKISPVKKFDFAGISFNYPSKMVFDYEEDGAYKCWTLQGSNVSIMVFSLDEEVASQALLDETINKFGKENCKQENCSQTLGDKAYHGKRITYTINGQVIHQEYYELLVSSKKSQFICLQDSPSDGGDNTDEFKQLFSSINTSLKLAEIPK